jgi:hypothetical protein
MLLSVSSPEPATYQMALETIPTIIVHCQAAMNGSKLRIVLSKAANKMTLLKRWR